jgi:integrase
MALTERMITSEKPPASGYSIIYDQTIPGFGLRVTAGGTKSFILDYQDTSGKNRRYTIGQYPTYKLTGARDEALQLRFKISKGYDPIRAKEQVRIAPTMKQLRDDYLERHARVHKREKSVYEDEAMLDGIIVPRLGELKVAAVTRRHMEDIQKELAATPYKCNRTISLLSKMFNLAVQWGWRLDNPTKGIPKFHEDKRVRWLSAEEMTRLTAALEKYPAKRAKECKGSAKLKAYARKEAQRAVHALQLIMLTGSRKSEVLKARREQFDLQRGLWVKPAHTTKEKREEHIPLNAQAIALVKSLPIDGDLLFPGRRRDQPLTDLKSSWSDICELAKLKDCRVHDLRHHYAATLVSNGVTLPVIGRLLGHSQASTTQRYAHVLQDPMREATNKFKL